MTKMQAVLNDTVIAESDETRVVEGTTTSPGPTSASSKTT